MFSNPELGIYENASSTGVGVDSRYSKRTSLMSIETISISGIGRRSLPPRGSPLDLDPGLAPITAVAESPMFWCIAQANRVKMPDLGGKLWLLLRPLLP